MKALRTILPAYCHLVAHHVGKARLEDEHAKNAKAKDMLDILHVLGSGSLLTDRESLRDISRSASSLVILLRNFHQRRECSEDGLQVSTHLLFDSSVD